MEALNMQINMDNILKAKFGETGGTIKAVFKKTINIKQYESEVIELESTLTVDEQLTGAERALVTAILQAQLEYTAYINLGFKAQISQQDLDSRKTALENEVAILKQKAEAITGISMDKYF